MEVVTGGQEAKKGLGHLGTKPVKDGGVDQVTSTCQTRLEVESSIKTIRKRSNIDSRSYWNGHYNVDQCVREKVQQNDGGDVPRTTTLPKWRGGGKKKQRFVSNSHTGSDLVVSREVEMENSGGPLKLGPTKQLHNRW